MDKKLKTLLSDFMLSFETVFDNDWDMTKSCILDSNFISDEATFLNPNVDDESNNWANRGGLLSQYRKLIEEMKNQGIHISWDDVITDK